MNFDLSDEQKMLGEQTRSLLADKAPYDRLRDLIDQNQVWDEALWRAISEMGLCAARIPEAYGGLGLGDLDLGVISEAFGAANVSLPFMSSVVCAADAINLAGSEAQKQEWLPQLANGEVVGCFAYAEGAAGWRPQTCSLNYDAGTLTGAKSPVADAGIANIAVVLCQHGDTQKLALVRLEQASINRVRRESFDQLRGQYEVTFNGAEAELLGNGASASIDTLFDRIAVQIAFESVGGAQACIHMARDYAMDRKIFNRALASYQAIKHSLADCLLQTEFSRSNAYYAGWSAAASSGSLAAASSAARLTSLQAFESSARQNLQIHGGIGYTFEANCHFFYRRERLNALMLGPKQYWADRLIEHMPTENEEAA